VFIRSAAEAAQSASEAPRSTSDAPRSVDPEERSCPRAGGGVVEVVVTGECGVVAIPPGLGAGLRTASGELARVMVALVRVVVSLDRVGVGVGVAMLGRLIPSVGHAVSALGRQFTLLAGGPSRATRSRCTERDGRNGDGQRDQERGQACRDRVEQAPGSGARQKDDDDRGEPHAARGDPRTHQVTFLRDSGTEPSVATPAAARTNRGWLVCHPANAVPGAGGLWLTAVTISADTTRS